MQCWILYYRKVIRGETGEAGADGADGKSFSIKAQYATEAALRSAHPTGSNGDAYFVGTDANPDLYVWLADDNTWFNSGKIAGIKGDKGDKGDDGYTPTITTVETTNGVIITITNKTGSKSVEIKDGTSPDISEFENTVAEHENEITTLKTDVDNFKNYGKTVLWSGSATKGDTISISVAGYDEVYAYLGAVWARLCSGKGGGTNGRKKFVAVYAGRDRTDLKCYEQYYILDILADGKVAVCGWFNVGSMNIQNARLAAQKALAGGTWSDPAWVYLDDVETNVTVTQIVGVKYRTIQ